MLVGKDNCIYIRDFLTQHLLAEIGAAINENAESVNLYKGGGAESVIFRIL